MNETADRFLLLDDAWPGTPPRFGHLASLLRLSQSPPQFRNENLVDSLFQCCQAAWHSATEHQRHSRSTDKWRATKCLDIPEDSPSLEVVLERLLARLTDDNWWNQVPVDNGLLDSPGGRNIDLVQRCGDWFSIMELKVNSNTPLSAAIQVLQYGAAYLFFRKCILPELRERADAAEPDIMQAAGIDLVVLAPASFYASSADSSWLENFERQMESQLAASTFRREVGIPMTFRFESFPRNFEWSLDLAGDAAKHSQVAEALRKRQRVFTPV